MKIIKVLSLICFLTIGILAQQFATVTGQLIDDGKIIANQKVKLVSQTESVETTTDADGNYRFENVADGNYLLVYNDKQASVKIENGQVSIAELAEVVVISANTTQTLDEVSKTVNVIDSEEITSRNEFSLTDSLRTIPGFRVQQLGGFGKTANIKTRGLRNQDTAILIDGIRFRDASSITGDASAFLSDFTLTNVDKIEVLRGSGSSLYGTNAIGGTLNFITPRPQNGWHGGILSELGGLGLKRFRGNLSGGNERIGFTSGISRTVFSEGIDENDDANNTNVQARIEYNPFAKTNISARFFVSDAFVKLNSNPDTLGALPASNAGVINANQGVNFVFDADSDDVQKSEFFNGQIVLTQIITDKLIFKGFYSGLKTSRRNEFFDSFAPAGADASTSVFDSTIQTADGQFNFTPNRFNQITFGFEFETEKFGNEGNDSTAPIGTGAFSTRARQSSNTIFAQDLVSLMDDKLQIAGGFRAQFFSLKNPTFSENNPPYSNLTLENPLNAYTFDGAASYFFDKSKTKIRFHVGNGYRVPSLYERFGTFFSSFSGEFFALGDPNLKPERSIAFDAGIEQNLFKNRAKLTATYFYTKLIDTIGFGNVVPNIGTTNRPFGGYLNTKGGIARGGEFSGQIRASGSTNIFASYTFTNSDQRKPQVSGSGIIQTLGIPEHQFTFVATQTFKRLTLNFDFVATSNYLAPIFSNSVFRTYIYRFDGNRKADLSASYTFPLKNEKLNLRLFGTIENLFDYDYYENGFRTAGRTARGGLSFSF